VIHDDEYRRVRAGGVPREHFERLVTGLVATLILLATAIAVERVANVLVDDPGVDPLDRHALLRLVPWVQFFAFLGVIGLAIWLLLDITRDLGARRALRKRRRDPLR